MPPADEPMDLGLFGAEDLEASLDPLLVALAKAADLCLKPYRHALRFSGEPPTTVGDCSDCVVRIEARGADGSRSAARDLELEIYRSGPDLNLMLSVVNDEQAPLLWHGSHAVWMHAASGERCDRPSDGAALEALCRRIRALLVEVDPPSS